MKELKYKNALYAIIYCACFITICIILCCVFGIIITYFFEHVRDFTLVCIIGVSLIGGVWIIAGLVIMLQGTVVVTEHEIKYYRWRTEKWRINKEDICECIYNKFHWYDFLLPITAINAFILSFRLKEGVISQKKYCSLSLKMVKEIHDTFHYPIRDIDTVFKQ